MAKRRRTQIVGSEKKIRIPLTSKKVELYNFKVRVFSLFFKEGEVAGYSSSLSFPDIMEKVDVTRITFTSWRS
ncbi:hypothetical protein K7X08_027515 [Anisodus acutangulus]|uniref:Uncharacterized protein n=1 Tax=Anisodus acutangulus TaxID=402998 RepID=A0A9Q1MJ19_9SOLA|nr:hypothetical protein K7X08_027515 [Anisodus acutangulus]